MTSLGETLRRARLQRNLDLNRIADELKISATMLRAIEEERFDKLPGGVFARSFVKQYARLLQVDETAIEGELSRVLEPASEPRPAHPVPLPDREIPLPRVSGWQAVSDRGSGWSSSAWALGLVVAAMLACAGAYAWWQHAQRPLAQKSPPARTLAPAPKSVPPAVTAAPPPPPRVPETPAPARIPLPAAAEPEPPTPAAVNGSPSLTPADAEAAVRVEVTAHEPTWISVRSDGQYQFSGTLEANQSRMVAGNRNVWLRVGNAGGVEIQLNGKPIGPLGANGLVRTLQFTSGGFQIVPPEASKPAPPTESPNPL